MLLPLECYTPGVGNTCGTGAFAVADPATLAWRYYVKLDPAEIPKAMWAETSPDGKLVWTSSGNDLLAYRTSDVSTAHAAPAAASDPGCAQAGGSRAPERDHRRGLRRRPAAAGGLEPTRPSRCGRSTRGPASGGSRSSLRCAASRRGSTTIEMLGGELHWLIGPDGGGCELTYGPSSALLHLVHRVGNEGLRVRIARVQPGPVVKVRVKRRGRPVARARVSLAGATARTNRNGRATLRPHLALSGRFAALAHRGGRWGRSALVSLTP